jgi:predicted patatin/cPLA2 family phospholipase
MAGLILEGGGMRAGFVAGAAMALMDSNVTRFGLAVGCSASVPTLSYFATGQRQEMENVWRYELNTPKLVCYRNIPYASLARSPKRPVLDIDYLVYDVFKGKYPLDLHTLIHNPMKCLFALTNASDGCLVRLSPGDDDIYRLLKASLAVPGCCPDTVRIGSDEYVDGGTANPLPVQALMDQGIHKILAILSKPMDCESEPPTLLERALFWRYFHRHDWMLERLWEAAHAYNDQVSLLESMARKEPPEAFILCPDRMSPAKFITRDKKKINRTIDLGYRKAMSQMGEIKNFLGLGVGSLEENKAKAIDEGL